MIIKNFPETYFTGTEESDLIALGFIITTKNGERQAKLPNSWKMEAKTTGFDLIRDDKGRHRAYIQKLTEGRVISLHRRLIFSIENDGKFAWGTVKAGKKEVYRTRKKYITSDYLEGVHFACFNWLNKNYPRYANPLAYWDQF